jgi:hypothetical protein
MPQDRTTATSPQTDPLDAITVALTADGPRTAGQLAEYMGIAYSTLTPRLRQLEADGRAERVKNPTTRQILWQATTTNDGPVDSAPAVSASSAPMSAPALDAAGVTGRDADLDTDDSAELDDDKEFPDGGHGRSAAVNTLGSGGPDTDEGALADDEPVIAAPATGEASGPTGKAPRRPKGSIAAAILKVTRADPDTTWKVSQLHKATGAGAGAIANAANKLVVAGELNVVCEKPVTYQAA